MNKKKDIFYIFLGLAIVIILMTIADTVAGDPGLPKCPARPTLNVRCEK